MVGEIMLIVGFEQHLSMYVEPLDRNGKERVMKVSEIVGDSLLTDLLTFGGHVSDYISD